MNDGENDSALMYNETMFKKAGIPVPWKPTSWQDIITAAQKIKKALPSVTPLWLNAGTGLGANGLLQGINNFIVGSSTPTIQTKSGKMVVDSPGIKAALGFYQQVYSTDSASETALFSPNAVTDPLSLFNTVTRHSGGFELLRRQLDKLHQCAGLATGRLHDGCCRSAERSAGTGIASTLAGWDLAISSHASDPQAAYNFINVAQDSTNLIDAANWAGWVPPVESDWALPAYTNFAPPYNADFAKILPSATRNTDECELLGMGPGHG